MQYLLLFHGNNGYANAPQYYVTRTYTAVMLTFAAAGPNKTGSALVLVLFLRYDDLAS
jgi:hypothetical protein